MSDTQPYHIPIPVLSRWAISQWYPNDIHMMWWMEEILHQLLTLGNYEQAFCIFLMGLWLYSEKMPINWCRILQASTVSFSSALIPCCCTDCAVQVVLGHLSKQSNMLVRERAGRIGRLGGADESYGICPLSPLFGRHMNWCVMTGGGYHRDHMLVMNGDRMGPSVE